MVSISLLFFSIPFFSLNLLHAAVVICRNRSCQSFTVQLFALFVDCTEDLVSKYMLQNM